MATEVKVIEMTLDGLPYGCPDCGCGVFTLDGRGIFDSLPAWGNCANYHSWEDPFLTIGDLKAILTARTGRQRPEDDDTFEITIGGAFLAGVLHPDLTPEDVKAVSRIYWRKIIKPGMRRQKSKAVRAGKAAVRRTVTKPTGDAVAATKAAALGAAWNLQAGGYQPDPDYMPEPVIPCGAGCTDGWFEIESRLHKTTCIRCAVCHGTGQID